MSFFKNLKLRTEDDEVLAEAVPAEEPAEIDVTEAVQAEEDALEVQEIEQNIEEEQEQVETQSEVLEELQEQEEVIDEKLEQPQEVTPEDVAVAQEAFAFTLGRLAGSSAAYKEYKKTKLSFEHAKTDPISALKLHREGLGEMASKVWESIKVMFAKIAEFFKKLFAKLPAMFGSMEKKAGALKTQVDGLDNGFKVKDSKELQKKHLAFLAGIKDGKATDIYGLHQSFNIQSGSAMEKNIEEVQKLSDPVKYADIALRSGAKPASALVKGNGIQAVLGFAGPDSVYAIGSEGVVTAKVEGFEGNLSKLESKSDLAAFVDQLVKIAKSKDEVIKTSDKVFKAVDKAIKKAVSGSKDEEAQKNAKLIRQIVLKCPGIQAKSFSTLLRGGCGYVSAAISAGEEKKEEKAEEAKA